MTFKLNMQDGLLRADKDGRIVEWSHISGFTTYIDTMGGRDVPSRIRMPVPSSLCGNRCRVGTNSTRTH